MVICMLLGTALPIRSGSIMVVPRRADAPILVGKA